MKENNFGQDVEFLNRHVETIVLANDEGARIVVVPAYQGRTMTSSSAGDAGTSFGYINYEAVSSKELDPQINLYGGEDRMWISPEGGQYSVFFPPGVEMEYSNWRTPPVLDTSVFEVIDREEHSIAFQQQASLVNWSGYEFQIRMHRRVNLLDRERASQNLNVDLGQLQVAAHESHNTLTNLGAETWQPSSGLIGIWMLCMNKPSSGATLVIPFKIGEESELGSIVNADYFGKLDEKRLQVDSTAGLIYFRGDGNLRSKLGLTFARVQSWLGSWDRERRVLSVVQFNLPEQAPHGYNNNLWQHQDNPYDGDVINGYNDGPNESGGKLGGFFELETISPALALAPEESYTHVHRTIRLEGERAKLNQVSQAVFGVALDEIESRLG